VKRRDAVKIAKGDVRDTLRRMVKNATWMGPSGNVSIAARGFSASVKGAVQAMLEKQLLEAGAYEVQVKEQPPRDAAEEAKQRLDGTYAPDVVTFDVKYRPKATVDFVKVSFIVSPTK